jgi:hypothetical protein
MYTVHLYWNLPQLHPSKKPVLADFVELDPKCGYFPEPYDSQVTFQFTGTAQMNGFFIMDENDEIHYVQEQGKTMYFQAADKLVLTMDPLLDKVFKKKTGNFWLDK